jgi:hypothetical protein
MDILREAGGNSHQKRSSFIKNITTFSIHGDKKPRQPQVHRALERLPATMN